MADPTWNDPTAQPLSVVPPDEWGGWLNAAVAEFAQRTKVLREQSISGVTIVGGAIRTTRVDGTTGPSASLAEIFNASTPGSAADSATAANVAAGELTRAALGELAADEESALALAFAAKIETAIEDLPTVPEVESIAAVAAEAVRPALPQLGALKRALDGARSVAASFFGDSTGDTDGSSAAADRTFSRFARQIAAKYAATHHVLFAGWDDATQDFKAWTVMNAHAAGRRGALISTRSLRNKTDTAAQFTTGNVDVRALVSFSTLSGATGTIATRSYKEVAGVRSADMQWEVRLHTSGFLYMRHSQDGATWLSDRISTVAVNTIASVNVPIWIRATLEIVPGTGFTVKFYTSTDGVTWAQLGANVTGGSGTTTAMHPAVDGAYFEIGAAGWQPTGSPLTGAKIYEVQIRDGVNGPMIAPAAIEEWERYGDSATTYVGAPTVYLLNASRSGSAMSYHTDAARLKKETPNYGQVAVVFNDGHNEGGASGSTWMPPFEAWVAAVKGRLPNAAVNVIGQNPHRSGWVNEAAYGAEHVRRIFELSAASSRLGWGFIDIYQAYLDDPRGINTLVVVDDIHPTAIPNGYALSGDTVAKAAGIPLTV